MQHEFLAAVRKSISDERLDAYRHCENDLDIELLSRYVWNIALSESMYPLLNNFEIALRNHLNELLSVTFDINWIDTVNPSILLENEVKAVNDAKKKLKKDKKPTSGGYLVSTLTLGFWTALTYSRYEQIIWPKLFKSQSLKAFPGLPRKQRTLKNLRERLHKINRLRNRVFHHEPIWNDGELEVLHQELLEAIEWINPYLVKKTQILNRFPDVYQEKKGISFYMDKINSIEF